MVPSSHLINISSWNANSIRNKEHEFNNFLVENSIDVACIQETMYNPNDNVPMHPDYFLYRNDRIVEPNIRASGGVAIKINRHLSHELLPSLNLNIIEAIGVRITLRDSSKLEIWSVYLPGGTSNTSIRQYYARDIAKLTSRRCSYFINGDLNSKHRMWNCSRANTAGTILHKECSFRNFIILYSLSI